MKFLSKILPNNYIFLLKSIVISLLLYSCSSNFPENQVYGQDNPHNIKPYLSQYNLKGKIKTLYYYNGYYSETYHFNKQGFLTHIDNGLHQKLSYNQQGKLTKIYSERDEIIFTYLPNNTVKQEWTSDFGNATLYYIYNNKGNLLSEESKGDANYKYLYEYDSQGRLLVKKYDFAYMKALKETEIDMGLSERSFMKLYEYDTAGNLRKYTEYDRNGGIEKIDIYKEGFLVETQRYEQNELFEKSIFTYDNGKEQETVYNQEGKLIYSATYNTTLDKQGNVILKTKEYEDNSDTIKTQGIKTIEEREIAYYP
jgi:putative YD repeat protein